MMLHMTSRFLYCCDSTRVLAPCAVVAVPEIFDSKAKPRWFASLNCMKFEASVLIENTFESVIFSALRLINISMVKSPSSNFNLSGTVPEEIKSAVASSKDDFPNLLILVLYASLLKVTVALAVASFYRSLW